VTARHGGLGLGTGPVSVTLAIMIVGFVGYLAVTRIDVRGARVPARSRVRRVLDPELEFD
jgi:hypothetical protein